MGSCFDCEGSLDEDLYTEVRRPRDGIVYVHADKDVCIRYLKALVRQVREEASREYRYACKERDEARQLLYELRLTLQRTKAETLKADEQNEQINGRVIRRQLQVAIDWIRGIR